MNDQTLDSQYLFDPESWDSKKRIRASDAIIEVNDHSKRMKGFRWFLIGLLVLNLLGLVYILTASTPAAAQEAGDIKGLVAIVGLVLMAPFVLAAVFLPRNPRLWFAVALITYVILLLLGGGSLTQGFVWKIAIVTALSYGLYSASEWEKNRKILSHMGYPSERLAANRKDFSPLERLPRKQR